MNKLNVIIDQLLGLDRMEIVFWVCVVLAPIGSVWYQYNETNDGWPRILAWSALWTLLLPIGMRLFSWNIPQHFPSRWHRA